ncbi:mechanosensitive ion channel domain-containing protein [Halobellus sp. EA9]|uniref:mechanosensitive ion channel domain-containing protein n=1 Tax=Halobellus sp. EA9 TaxID=3421647 RepID=UPI003EBB889C
MTGVEAPAAASGAVPTVLQFDTRLFDRVIRTVPREIWAALVVIVVGLTVAFVLGALTTRILVRLGVPEAIEGTAFERTARNFDTSTVEVLGSLVRYFVIGIAALLSLSLANISIAATFWSRTVQFLPQLFIAVVILIVGVVVGDKAHLVVSERLTGIKLPQIGVFPQIAKVTVFYIAVLVALSQLGVATLALVVLLAAYLFAVVLLAGIALSDLLKSGAAGSYLLLNQPYAIGDEVEIGGNRGIVQEVNLFVTHIENDGEEFVVPNSAVFEDGVVRIRD